MYTYAKKRATAPARVTQLEREIRKDFFRFITRREWKIPIKTLALSGGWESGDDDSERVYWPVGGSVNFLFYFDLYMCCFFHQLEWIGDDLKLAE